MRYYDPGDAPANVPQDPPPVYDIPAWTPPPSYYEPTPLPPVPAYEPPPVNYGWGSATNANDLNTIPGNTLTYDVPGSYVDPSPPYEDPKYYTPPEESAVFTPTNPGWGLNPDYPGYTEPGHANVLPPSWGYDVPGTPEAPSPPYVDPSSPEPEARYGPSRVRPGTPGRWNKTDFMSMVPGDWQVTAQEAFGRTRIGSKESSLQEALRQAFIDFGGDPSKLDDRFRAFLDAPTIEAARANKYSKIAQNLQSMRKSLATKRAQLASRRMTFSGVNTGMTRDVLEDKERADINAARGFTDPAGQGLRDLADLRTQVEKDNADTRGLAAARLAALYPDVWEEGTPDEIIPGERIY